MNSLGKALYEQALKTTITFGAPGRPNAVAINNAAIYKRNFKGADQKITPKDGGRSFVKKGRRFTLALTEDLFNALRDEKGECSYNVWAFGGEEDPDLKLYCIEVIVNMASSYPPTALLYTARKDGKWDISDPLTDTSIGILDEVDYLNIERVDIVVNPYDKDKTGNFTLYLNSIKMAQKHIEDGDDYWSANIHIDEEMPRRGDDPNVD